MFVVSLQWKPPEKYHGWVSFHATVVENYQVFWIEVQSAPLYIIPEGSGLVWFRLGREKVQFLSLREANI